MSKKKGARTSSASLSQTSSHDEENDDDDEQSQSSERSVRRRLFSPPVDDPDTIYNQNNRRIKQLEQELQRIDDEVSFLRKQQIKDRFDAARRVKAAREALEKYKAANCDQGEGKDWYMKEVFELDAIHEQARHDFNQAINSDITSRVNSLKNQASAIEAEIKRLKTNNKRAKQRANELLEARERRLAKKRELSQSSRDSESEEEYERRLAIERQRFQALLESESSEDTDKRRRHDREQTQDARSRETPEHTLRRNLRNKLRMRSLRLCRRVERLRYQNPADINNFEHNVPAALEMIAQRTGLVPIARINQSISAAVAQDQYVEQLCIEYKELEAQGEGKLDDFENEIAEQMQLSQELHMAAQQLLNEFLQSSMPSDDKERQLIEECIQSMGAGRPLFFCGSCGIRQVPSEREYEQMALSDLVSKFEYTAEECAAFDARNLFYQLVKSSFLWVVEAPPPPADIGTEAAAAVAADPPPPQRIRLHLHQESISSDPHDNNNKYTRLCSVCAHYAKSVDGSSVVSNTLFYYCITVKQSY